MLALGFGERGSIDPAISLLMRDTGIAHLMAISGLHIGMSGTLGWLLARALQFGLPEKYINYRLPVYCGVLFTAAYTVISGASPPAVRTFISITITLALRLTGKNWHSWQIWMVCIAVILFIDPLTILSESFWLSAFAVATLIFWFQWLPGYSTRTLWRLPLALVHLQFGIGFLLLPLQILLFHGASLTSLPANLIAVPVISFITVPLILAGIMVELTGWRLAEFGLWYLADRSLELVFRVLAALPEGWREGDSRLQWLGYLPWLMVVWWRCRHWLCSHFIIPVATVLLALPFWPRKSQGEWSVHMLDIGQGLAVVIERAGKALLYDTGHAWPGGDSAKQTIIPWLRWHHLEPQGIILSHNHLDHSGGMKSLLQAWPHLQVRSSVASPGWLPCSAGQRWRWQGLQFTVHWPPDNYTGLENNRSCVVKVSDGRFSMLLTGDIESAGELALLRNATQALNADVLQVPHHGSRTSSSSALLSAVRGKTALASVSRYNAWRLPSRPVVRRYRQQGYHWYDTANSGQLTVNFSSGDWQIKGLREHISPRWYHQRFGEPDDKG